MSIPASDHVFFAIIFFVGVLTIFTDLRSKKIYNAHLILGGILSLFAISYAAVIQQENITPHLISGLAAFIFGFILYKFSLWRGGDTKLFVLYAFLMPAPQGTELPFSAAFYLFVCSFTAGMIILFPFFLIDIIKNNNNIIHILFSRPRRGALFDGAGAVLCLSWIIFPIYYVTKITHTSIILWISYMLFSWAYRPKKEIPPNYIADRVKKNYKFLCLLFLFGLGMRLWLAPQALSFRALFNSTLMILLSVVVSASIHTAISCLKEYRDRVSFAPLLFIGCLLSYTPFLNTLLNLNHQWNILLPR